jgi:hypothetical protein
MTYWSPPLAEAMQSPEYFPVMEDPFSASERSSNIGASLHIAAVLIPAYTKRAVDRQLGGRRLAFTAEVGQSFAEVSQESRGGLVGAVIDTRITKRIKPGKNNRHSTSSAEDIDRFNMLATRLDAPVVPRSPHTQVQASIVEGGSVTGIMREFVVGNPNRKFFIGHEPGAKFIMFQTLFLPRDGVVGSTWKHYRVEHKVAAIFGISGRS